MPFRGTDEKLVFIAQNVGATVFVEPSVKVSQVSDEIWNGWKQNTMLTLKGWSREFQDVEYTDDVLAISEDIKREKMFLDTADSFSKTPAKRKRDGDTVEGDPQLMVDLKAMRYTRVRPSDKEELENMIDYGMKIWTIPTIVSGTRIIWFCSEKVWRRWPF